MSAPSSSRDVLGCLSKNILSPTSLRQAMAIWSFTVSGQLAAMAVVAIWSVIFPQVEGKHVFCYYSSFAQGRPGKGQFLPEDIDPNLCTHVIFAFVDITPDGSGLVPFNSNDQGPNGLYARTLALKEQNPSLKVLLAVGGWRIGSEPFVPVVRSEQSRKAWIANVVKYLRRHGFDGFDMDWEFPATRGSGPQDKHRFTLLMKGLYEAFARESDKTGQEKLLLTMATASGTYYISQSYETSEIVKYLDFMLLMTYNYHGQWEQATGHHSGLYRHSSDPKQGEKSQLYQEWSIDFWLNAGMPKDRLVVGVPTYAMTFTLADQSQHGVSAPAAGGGTQGEFTGEPGILSYYEVCERLQNRNWESQWIEEQGVPIAYGGNQWAGYEDKRSVTLKAKNIVKRNLAGAFVWSVEMDDFGGQCGLGPYPLLQAINDVIGHQPMSRPASKLRRKPQLPKENPPATVASKDESPKTTKSDKNLPHQTKDTTVSRKQSNRRRVKFARRKYPGLSGNKQRGPPHHAVHRLQWRKIKASTTAPPTAVATPINRVASRRLTTPIRNRGLLKKIKRKPGYLMKGRKETLSTRKVPQTSYGYYYSPEALTKILASHTTTRMTDMVSKEEPRTWWFRSSPRPPTVGWTRMFPHNSTKLSRRKFKKFTSKSGKHENDAASASAAANVLDCGAMGVGLFPHPMSCDEYVVCQGEGWLSMPSHVMKCPVGTRFDPGLKICNFATDVDCPHEQF